MRLYNAESCTPVTTTSTRVPQRAKWVPSKRTNPRKAPWSQNILKKNNSHRVVVDLDGPNCRETSQTSVSEPSSFHDSFNPFGFHPGNVPWNSVEVSKPHGSPESNKGSTKTSSTNRTTSTDELTPVPINFQAEAVLPDATSKKDSVVLQPVLQAQTPVESMEKEKPTFPDASSGEPSDDSSLTSSSTFSSTSSESDLLGETLSHYSKGATLLAPISPTFKTVSPSEYEWPPKSFKQMNPEATNGFPLFDIDSMSISSSATGTPSTKGDELKARDSDEDSAYTVVALPPSTGFACKLDVRFRGVLKGSSQCQKGTTPAPSFVPQQQAAIRGDEVLAVRARLKKVTTMRGAPFRAHQGVSPPPQKEKRSNLSNPTELPVTIQSFMCDKPSQNQGPGEIRDLEQEPSSPRLEQSEWGVSPPIEPCSDLGRFANGVHSDFEESAQQHHSSLTADASKVVEQSLDGALKADSSEVVGSDHNCNDMQKIKKLNIPPFRDSCETIKLGQHGSFSELDLTHLHRGTSSEKGGQFSRDFDMTNLNRLLQERLKVGGSQPLEKSEPRARQVPNKHEMCLYLSDMMNRRPSPIEIEKACVATTSEKQEDREDRPSTDVVRCNQSNVLSSRKTNTTHGGPSFAATTSSGQCYGSNEVAARKNVSGHLQSIKDRNTDGSGLETSDFKSMDSRNTEHNVLQSAPTKASGVSQGKQVPVKDDPKYAKYFKMLKLGLPLGAVKNALQRDGLNPCVMDADHNEPASTEGRYSSSVLESPPKDTHRRTRLHWHTHDNVGKSTVWAMLARESEVSPFSFDEGEFTTLFRAELKPSANTANVTQSPDATTVKVIDRKRANNGGIILARIKLTYEEMAQAVDTFDVGALTPEQIRGIIQLLPTAEEKTQLRSYLSKRKTSVEGLCECEKFMVAIMDVPHSKRKLDALLFMQKLSTSIKELREDTHLVQVACEEIMSSVRFRKVLGVILEMGNRLNTAGLRRKAKACAITLDSLLMLNQAKAFDRKTTFLHYVVRLLWRQSPELTHFKDDMPTVIRAQRVHWDLTVAELGRLQNELENVRKIALFHGRDVSNVENQQSEVDTLGDKTLGLSPEEEARLLQSTNVGLFALKARLEVASIVDAVESCKHKHTKLVQYFGEEDRKQSLKPHEVFQIISTFFENFDDATAEMIAEDRIKMRANPEKTDCVSIGLRSSGTMDSSISTISGSPSKKKFRSNMSAVLGEMRNKSKKKIRWGRKKR